MKRSRKTSRKQNRKRQSSRVQAKQNRSLNYESLEARQMLTVGIGVSLVGANQGVDGINTLLPNPEGDIGPNHFVEVGQQTFTVYNRQGGIVESSSLNQFFDDAGADRQGESLEAPRVIYDRGSERWFVVATGNGQGNFAGNRIQIAFSDTSDPTGQWRSENFVASQTGLELQTRATLGIDADGIYIATQNFEFSSGVLGDIQDVSVFSIPKADLLKENPTVGRLTRFDDLSIFEYGQSIQFASNFDGSDGTVYAFSTSTLDINEGTGLDPVPVLNPALLNSFQVTDATDVGANISDPTTIILGAFAPPVPILQPDVSGVAADNVLLEFEAGLNASLIESNGSIFGAQTVGFPFVETLQDIRVNGINWFELMVGGGADPVLAGSQSMRGPNNFVFVDGTFLGDNLPDIPDMDPATPTFETGNITYFNPAIAVTESGLVALTFNAVNQAEAVNFGVVQPENALRVSTFAAVGISVNGATSSTDMMGNPIFERASIQFENPAVLTQSVIEIGQTSRPFNQDPEPISVWGGYSSLRPDPANPNAFLSVIPYQEFLFDADGESADDLWAVAINEILPIELTPVVEATAQADEIIVRIAADDPNIIEVEINGVVTDRFQSELISEITILAHGGADTVIVDHINGDPTPVDGFNLHGGGNVDTFESRSNEKTFFDLNSATFGIQDIFIPFHVAGLIAGSDGFVDGLAQDGGFTLTTIGGEDLEDEQQLTNLFVDFENLIGGSNDDTFQFVNGSLFGDAEGRAGDDRFVFLDEAGTDGSVNGGTGFNTLDLQERTSGTEIELFSIGANVGFNGRTLEGPVGQPNQILDQFRDISLVRGSLNLNVVDSIQALNQFEATFTLNVRDIEPNDIANPANADAFVASTYEANGRTLFFTDFDTIKGSVLDDVFNVQSNDANQLPVIRLDGRSGDDEFNFSSDSPTNEGELAPIRGLFEVNGGTGANSLIVSDFGRLGEDEFLVLSARISGPVEIVYFAEDEQTMAEGTFDVTLIGSDGAAGDTFFLQSFLSTNTLNVFGMGGNDEFVIQDLSQSTVNVFGGEGDDTYIIEQVSGIDNRNVTITDSVDAENDRAVIAGTILDEIFIVDIDSFVSDQFEFIGVEEFGFDGRGGNDEFYVRAISENFPIVLLGGDGDDVFHISSDAPTNLGDLTMLNNDLNIDGGMGVNRIIISNESGGPLDVEVTTDMITGLFNGVLTYSSTGGVFDHVDGGINITGSNGGDDTFRISSFLGQHSLKIDGRLGSDEFIIGSESEDNIDGEVVVDGGSDGDTYTIFLGNIASNNVVIQDSGFSGSDIFNVIGTEGMDLVTLSEFGLSSGGANIAVGSFIEEVSISGMGGADNIVLANSPADFVTISGGDGDDSIQIDGTVGALTLDLFGDQGNDWFIINETSQLTNTIALGGDGMDVFDISSNVIGDVVADGGLDSDQYFVDYVGSGSRSITIVDSGMDGIDSGELFGTMSDDQFDINNNNVGSASEVVIFNATLESLSVSGRGDADIFNVTESTIDLSLDGQNGNDVFNLSSNAPGTTGSAETVLGTVTIQGGDGLNQLNITNRTGDPSLVTITNNMITGLTGGGVVNYFSNDGQFARTDGEIGGIEIFGSNTPGVGERFDIQSLSEGDTIRIHGLDGDDVFDIGNGTAGDVFVDGGDGSDTYNFQFGSPFDREVIIEDTGATGMDMLSLVGSANNDVITISTTSISDGNSSLSFNVPLSIIEIMSLDGDDTFVVNGAFTSTVRLHGNSGNDMFTVNSTANIDNLDVFGGIGNDMFQFNGSSDPTRIDAFGWEGNDSFVAGTGALGRLFLNGQDGSDTYEVMFAGDGERRINTRDSGATGTDVTTVYGTNADDRIAVRTTRFIYDDELVIFDQNTEQVIVQAQAGDDRIVVFGSRSPITEVFAGGGNDVFVVNSTSRTDQVDLEGNTGNDTFNVFKTTAGTTTNLFGNADNDRFNIGSTANADNGNLGRIRGNLNVFGGSNLEGAEDQLYLNDNGVDAAYSYNITPTRIDPIPGPANLPRDNFAGVGFNSSVEFVRLDGTPQVNQFRVTASQATRFFFDGNSPNGNVGDRLNVVFEQNDGRQMFFSNPQQSNGFVTFANGNEMIQFENIETATLASGNGGTSNFSLPTDFDFSDFDNFFSTADLEDWEEIDFGLG